MQALIDQYKNNPVNKELEIRLRNTGWDNWSMFFGRCADKFLSTFQLEQTINFISDSSHKSQSRRTLFFKNGVKQKEEVRVNKKIIMETFHKNYKYSLSEEIPVDTFNTHNVSLIRLRLRASFMPFDDWRLDFTFVREVQKSQLNQLPQYKEEIFPNGKILTTKNFIDFIQSLGNPNDPQYRQELEFEYIGDEKTLTQEDVKDKIDEISKVFDPDSQRTQELQKISSLFLEKEKTPRSLKQFVNQPIVLIFEDYTKIILPDISNYYLSDKADGERALLYINPDEDEIKLFRSQTITDLSEHYVKKLKKPASNITILDTEVIFQKKKNSEIDKIYIFDILMLGGKSMVNLPFSDREKEFEKVAQWLSPLTEKKIQIRLSESNYADQISKIYDRSTRMYPVDGLIFTPVDGEYFNMSVYKWKPPEQMTIDFLIIEAPKNLIGVRPYLVESGERLYFLLCGIRYQIFKSIGLEYFPGYREVFEELKINLRDNYFPIQFAPSKNPLVYIWKDRHEKQDLHGHVGEFRYDVENSKWILIKMRPDRDANIQEGTAYGNDFKIAEEIFQQFFHPFSFDMLVKKIDTIPIASNTGYFAEKKSEIYKPITKFNNFVKAQLIRQLEHSLFVIDFASGQGADLFTYIGFGIHNLLFMDKDTEALVEINRRKYDGMSRKEFYIYGKPPKNPPNIYIKEVDLTIDCKKIHKQIKDVPFPKNGVDGIVMNLAIHYIISDQNKLDNLINLVDKLLKPGGIFIFTCFDGQRIFDTLSKTEFESAWNLRDVENTSPIKYSIKKLYQSDILTEFGQKISVIHPFSQGNYYEEHLVNIDHVISCFQKKGFEVRQNSSFLNWLNKFKAFNPKVSSELDSSDTKYAGLYQYVSLWKSIS
jgi:SAM-dependent methyltransferase